MCNMHHIILSVKLDFNFVAVAAGNPEHDSSNLVPVEAWLFKNPRRYQVWRLSNLTVSQQE